VLAQAQLRMPSYSDHFRTAVMPASSRTEPADLDTLNEFLMSDRAPENSMGLSDLDGFLTALAVPVRGAMIVETPPLTSVHHQIWMEVGDGIVRPLPALIESASRSGRSQ
jgi:hypothetical protein